MKQLDLHSKSSEVYIKTRSPPASLPFNGQVIEHTAVKPWPNGVPSRPKFSTCVYLRVHLVRASVHLHWLATTCAHFGWDQICTLVEASFSPFDCPTQVSVSWVTSINLLLANEIEQSLPKTIFLWLASTCKETCESVWPPNASLFASSTCVHLWLLAGPFGQGLKWSIENDIIICNLWLCL